MKSKNRYNLLHDIGFIIVGIILIAIGVTLYLDNNNLENQLIKSEALIDEIILQDSINSEQKSNSDKIIEKYIEDCNILINGKKVSTDDLVIFMNEQQITNQELSESYNELLKSYNKLVGKNNVLLKSENILSDSLSIYKAYIELSKKNFDVDFSVSKNKNKDKYVAQISLPNDSTHFYKELYGNLKTVIKDKYGIDYQVQIDENGTKFFKEPTKIDTLMLFYDDIIFKETNNRIKIKLR